MYCWVNEHLLPIPDASNTTDRKDWQQEFLLENKQEKDKDLVRARRRSSEAIQHCTGRHKEEKLAVMATVVPHTDVNHMWTLLELFNMIAQN